MTQRQGPPGRFVAVCRDYLDGREDGVTSVYRALLPALAQLGVRVSVLCESPHGIATDTVSGGVDVHALTVRDDNGGPVYLGAALWAQSVGDWVDQSMPLRGIHVVDAPTTFAEGLHVRYEGIPLVGRVCTETATPAWFDGADPLVMRLMEEEATEKSLLLVGTAPHADRSHLLHPLARSAAPSASRGIGGTVLVIDSGTQQDRVSAIVRAIRSEEPLRVVAAVRTTPAVDAHRASPNIAERADASHVVATDVPGLMRALATASLVVLPADADIQIAVDALAAGVPVVTDAQIDTEALGRPAGLVCTDAGDLPSATTRALTDLGLTAAAAAEAGELQRRWSPKASAAQLVELYGLLSVEETLPRRSATPPAGMRFSRDRASLSVAIAGDADWSAPTLGRLRRSAGSWVVVTTVGGPESLDLAVDDTHAADEPAVHASELCAIAARKGGETVVGIAGSAQFDAGWVANVNETLLRAESHVGVIAPYPSGYRIERLSDGSIVLELQPRWVTSCDVVMSPVLCMRSDLAETTGASDPLVRAFDLADRVRAAGFRVAQADVGIYPHVQYPYRIHVPRSRVAALEAAGHQLEARVVELTTASGFSHREVEDGLPYWWMGAMGILRAELPVPGVWEFSFAGQSFVRPREVRVAGPDGKAALIGRATPTAHRRLSHRIEADAGPITLKLLASGEPLRPADLNPAADDVRPLSLRVSYPLMERVS